MKVRIFIGDNAGVFTPQSMRFVTPFRGEFVRPVSHLDFLMFSSILLEQFGSLRPEPER